MDSNPIPSTVSKVISDVSSKPLASFGELISLWLFGKSIGKFEAQKQIANEKEFVKWEAEKPWFQKAQEQKFVREYSNLGSVLVQAQPLLNSDLNNIENDNDLFYGLLEYAKDITNSEMQDLLSKIIAGEYNNPETYSMSTLHTLKSIDSKILRNFEGVLSIALVDIGIFKDSFSDTSDIQTLGFSYTAFLELQDIGLISTNESKITTQQIVVDLYSGKKVYFIPKNETDKNIILPDCYFLTNPGKEIARHLKVIENNNYSEWLKTKYKNRNFTVEVK